LATKREEDTAYALLGIFNVHIPMIYGEGKENAMKRLRKVLDNTLAHDRKATKIWKWLSAPDPSDNYQNACKLRQEKTSLWLLESDLYKKWKKEASLIWLCGIPGCGKTVLSSAVLDDILEHTTNDPGKAVAYFYFDFNDEKKQDANLMVRSLVSQLSQHYARVPQKLDSLFSSCRGGQQQPSDDAVFGVLQTLVDEFPCTYFVIDALNECINRKELVSVIRRIVAWKAQGLHILFTSRRERDIESALEGMLDNWNILSIPTDAVDNDIQRYVCRRLSEDHNFQKWPSDDKKLIKSSLRGTCGM
jgi:hypothetical protein